MSRIRLILLALLLLPPGTATGASSPPAAGPGVVLISLDGTRPQDVRDLPLFRALARRGAAAERLLPVFPTNTFPNHVSLVTGVAPDVHGIVNNVFLDPERGRYDYEGDPTWLEVEPLWSLAAAGGIGSASFFWVGSEGPWRSGRGPREWHAFDSKVSEQEKIDRILAWLALPAPERPRLVTAWFRGADGAAHRHGPGAPEVARSLAPQVRALARLVESLDARGAWETTTLVLVSDHGMRAVERSVDLEAALRGAKIDARVHGGGGFVTLSVPGGAEEIGRAVAAARGLGLEAHARERAPADWRVGHARFGDVVVLAPPGTLIGRGGARGMHGYAPSDPAMGGILFALGRGAAPGTALGRVRALDVAPTVLVLLGLAVPEWMEGRPIGPLLPAGATLPAP